MLCFLSSVAAATSLSGSLDKSFNFPDGYSLFNSAGNGNDRGVDVAIQADGKIVVLGYSNNGANEDLLLARYNADGTMDRNFGIEGFVLYDRGGNDRGLGLALQTDGKIVAVGFTYLGSQRDVLVLRYHTNGTLDKDFGTNGSATYSSPGSATDIGFGMALQPDGKLVITGFSHNGSDDDMLVLRLSGPADALSSRAVALSAQPLNEGMAGPSLEQKIGQMVITGFVGTAADDPGVLIALDHVRKAEAGGVIFYGYNIVNPDQVRLLTKAFADANPFAPSSNSPNGLPLPIAVDQEGGLVQRLKVTNGFFSTPSAEDMALNYSPEGAYLLYLSMAGMLKDAGFTWNFGPVVDLRGYPDDPERRPISSVIGQYRRSYSENPATIVEYASAFVKAHREAGVATTLKHYPGHGLASADSHMGLVDITDTALPVEREPFRAMIRASMADSVMTAHLVNRNRDSENPVTLSPGFMDTELRGVDGFGGVIVTDDLCMGAIQLYHSLEDTVIKAIKAGDDILLFSNNPAAAKNVPGYVPDYDISTKVIGIVMAAIARGEIDESRIEASWARIRSLRERMRQ